MKAYGIPVSTVVWKQPAASNGTGSNGVSTNNGHVVKVTESIRTVAAGTTAITPDSPTTTTVVSTSSIKQEVPDGMEGCLTSKQLEEFMDDDCHGPVSSGDPMLSSPHLSPHGVLPSPASSGSHYSANDDNALTPDSMDLAVWQSASDQISNSSSSSPIYVSSSSTAVAVPALTAIPLLPSTPVPPSAVTSSSPASSCSAASVGLRSHQLFMLPASATAVSVASSTVAANAGTAGNAMPQGTRLTTLERRDSDKALIESALTNTEKIVANLLAANQKQVVLKERTPNCFVVLWLADLATSCSTHYPPSESLLQQELDEIEDNNYDNTTDTDKDDDDDRNVAELTGTITV